jgi:hypothetical protein
MSAPGTQKRQKAIPLVCEIAEIVVPGRRKQQHEGREIVDPREIEPAIAFPVGELFATSMGGTRRFVVCTSASLAVPPERR